MPAIALLASRSFLILKSPAVTKLPPIAIVLAALLMPETIHAQPSSFTAPGRVEAESGTMSIGSAASGTVKEVLAREWSHVRAGDLLLTLDCRPLEVQVQAQNAQLSAAEAVFDRVRNGPRPDEIVVGEAAVGYSNARADEAQKAFERTLALQEGVTITTARKLEVQRDARVTAAHLAEARAKLALLRAGSRREDVMEAEARKNAAAAEVEAVRARLEQCSIRAPVNGTVTSFGQCWSILEFGCPGAAVTNGPGRRLEGTCRDRPTRFGARVRKSSRYSNYGGISQRFHPR
jgi:multidrug resistance efflux pump